MSHCGKLKLSHCGTLHQILKINKYQYHQHNLLQTAHGDDSRKPPKIL
jgi:hypothetical protein